MPGPSPSTGPMGLVWADPALNGGQGRAAMFDEDVGVTLRPRAQFATPVDAAALEGGVVIRPGTTFTQKATFGLNVDGSDVAGKQVVVPGGAPGFYPFPSGPITVPKGHLVSLSALSDVAEDPGHVLRYAIGLRFKPTLVGSHYAWTPGYFVANGGGGAAANRQVIHSVNLPFPNPLAAAVQAAGPFGPAAIFIAETTLTKPMGIAAVVNGVTVAATALFTASPGLVVQFPFLKTLVDGDDVAFLVHTDPAEPPANMVRGTILCAGSTTCEAEYRPVNGKQDIRFSAGGGDDFLVNPSSAATLSRFLVRVAKPQVGETRLAGTLLVKCLVNGATVGVIKVPPSDPLPRSYVLPLSVAVGAGTVKETELDATDPANDPSQVLRVSTAILETITE